MAQESASAQANAESYGKIVYIIGYGVLAIGAIYGDVMFIKLLAGSLPGGVLGFAAIIGAFLTSGSLIGLVIGKSVLFRPGDQTAWAWIFTWIEIAVMMLNVLLSVLRGMNIDPGYLNYWLYICPATPFVAVVGWMMIIYADPRRRNLHEDMAMADQILESQRKHHRHVHQVRLELQNSALEQQRVYMEQYMQTKEIQAALKHGSQQIALGIISEIIQRPVMPTIDALPQIIDSTARKSDTAAQPAIRRQTARSERRTAQPKKLLPRKRRFVPARPPAPASDRQIDTEEMMIPLANPRLRPGGEKPND